MSNITFMCYWCHGRLRIPLRPMGPAQSTYEYADTPIDPWREISLVDTAGLYMTVDCCPDCHDAYFPPPILPATET
jgi:hypothetical protein